jgi:hypothetical protein
MVRTHLENTGGPTSRITRAKRAWRHGSSGGEDDWQKEKKTAFLKYICKARLCPRCNPRSWHSLLTSHLHFILSFLGLLTSGSGFIVPPQGGRNLPFSTLSGYLPQHLAQSRWSVSVW